MSGLKNLDKSKITANFTAIDMAFLRLSSSDPNIRKYGAQVISQLIPRSQTKKIQYHLIIETHPGVIKWLSLALANIGDPTSVTILLEKLKSTTDRDAIDWIRLSISKLTDNDSHHRFKDLLLSSDSEKIAEAAAIAWNNPKLSGVNFSKLTRLLDHVDPHVRRWAVLSLGSSGYCQNPEVFYDSLRDDDYLVREWSEWALAQLADPSSFSNIIANVWDSHPRVREWATRSITSLNVSDMQQIAIEYYWNEIDVLCRESVIFAITHWKNMALLKEFVMKVIKYEHSKIIFAALIRSVISTELKNDIDIARELCQKIQSLNDEYLNIELENALYITLTARERKLLNTVESSPGAKRFIINAANLKKTDSSRYVSRSYDACYIIALREEFDVFVEILRSINIIPERIDERRALYHFNRGGGQGNVTSCLIMLISDMGPVRASLATFDILKDHSIDTVISVGIAAGIHDDIGLFDVVIGNQVDDYLANAKVLDKDASFQFVLSGDPYKSNINMVTMASNYEDTYKEQFDYLKEMYLNDLDNIIPCADLTKLRELNMCDHKLHVHVSNIGSSSIVVNSREFIRFLHSHDRNYKVIDMETSGIAAAIRYGGGDEKLLIVRGISDYGDERKKVLDNMGKGAVRKVAMRNASRFAMEILRNVSSKSRRLL